MPAWSSVRSRITPEPRAASSKTGTPHGGRGAGRNATSARPASSGVAGDGRRGACRDQLAAVASRGGGLRGGGLCVRLREVSAGVDADGTAESLALRVPPRVHGRPRDQIHRARPAAHTVSVLPASGAVVRGGAGSGARVEGRRAREGQPAIVAVRPMTMPVESVPGQKERFPAPVATPALTRRCARPNCESVLDGRRRHARFCSAACRASAWKSQREAR